MFDVSISMKNNKILGEFLVDSYFFDQSKYTYAFYLYRDNERIDFKWYAKDLNVVFNLKDAFGVFYIKVFVKDIEHEDARSFISKKLIIE